MLDLSTPADLSTFLEGGPFASHTVLPLGGGSANYTFRLTLKKPYQGIHTAMLKHGKRYIAGMQDIAFDLERQVCSLGIRGLGGYC